MGVGNYGRLATGGWDLENGLERAVVAAEVDGLAVLGVDRLSREPTSSFGTLAFNNAWTQQNALTASASSGNAVASLLLGYPNTGSVLNNQAMAYSSHCWAGFVEDDYRVSRKLTLNIGLRWDYESPITDRYI
jgi:hypothetical protein